MSEQKSAEENIMLAVLGTQIQDYINAIEIGGDRFLETSDFKYERLPDKKKEAIDRGMRAKYYIFDDPNSDNYVFGFNFICRYIGLDPDKLKTNIKLLKKKTLKDLYERIKEF